MNNFLERLQIAFRVRLAHAVDKWVIQRIKPRKKTAKKLLIIRLDAIGDYILFRNFLEEIATSKKYKGYELTLCGNIIWKSLFEAWDKAFLSDAIWIDRKKFERKPLYRYQKQKQIREAGFEIAIEPTFSRMLLFGDAIVRVSDAEKRIGNKGNTDNIIPKEKRLGDLHYNYLIDTGSEIVFEFDRNKFFFEKLLEKNIQQKAPSLLDKISTQRKPHQIALFVGASEPYKQWHWRHFQQLIERLAERNSAYQFVLLGGRAEEEIAKRILDSSKKVRATTQNFVNQTDLIELSNLIAQNSLLITNETVAAHLGASTKTPTICIANGRHIGRFSPYPGNYHLPMKYIFPPQIEYDVEQFSKEEVYEKYCNSAGSDINQIEVDDVLRLANKLLQHRHDNDESF